MKKSVIRKPALSWRRLSMRKTCPVVIPEQNLQNNIVSHPQAEHQSYTNAISHDLRNIAPKEFTNDSHDPIETNGNYCHDAAMLQMESPTPRTLATTSSSEYFLGDDEYNQMPSTSSFQNGNNCDNEFNRTNQLPELSSLNNEFLNTILTTQQNETNVHRSPSHLGNGVDDDASRNATTTYDDTRPRQLGRRSEIRSRIVSITAERCSEGNQVKYQIYRKSLLHIIGTLKLIFASFHIPYYSE